MHGGNLVNVTRKNTVNPVLTQLPTRVTYQRLPFVLGILPTADSEISFEKLHQEVCGANKMFDYLERPKFYCCGAAGGGSVGATAGVPSRSLS